MVTVIVLFFFIIIAFDFLPSRKIRPPKEIVLYWTILSVAFCVLILYSFIIIIPGPTKAIKYVVEKFIFKSGG